MLVSIEGRTVAVMPDPIERYRMARVRLGRAVFILRWQIPLIPRKAKIRFPAFLRDLAY